MNPPGERESSREAGLPLSGAAVGPCADPCPTHAATPRSGPAADRAETARRGWESAGLQARAAELGSAQQGRPPSPGEKARSPGAWQFGHFSGIVSRWISAPHDVQRNVFMRDQDRDHWSRLSMIAE